MNKIRNILLFGRTGNGKSTLGNVLLNKNNFEEVFKESELGVSETKNIQVEKFNIDLGNESITYRIIDVIGVGDTKLSPEAVLFKLAMLAKEVKDDGINRIFFLSSGRFTKEEADAYRLLSEVIFDKEVHNHTTIVRTNFAHFRNKDKCDEDVQALKNLDQASFPIISSIARSNIVHVNNSPSEEDDTLKNRKASREILLAHLAIRQEIYRPEGIDQINEKIQEHIDKEKEAKEKVEKEVKDLREKLDAIKKEREDDRVKMAKEAKEAKEEAENRLKEIKNKLEEAAEKQKKLEDEALKAKKELEKSQEDRKNEIEKQVGEIKSQLEEMKKKKEALEKQAEEARKGMAEKQKKLDEMKNKEKTEKSQLEKQIADLQQSLEKLKKESQGAISQEMQKHVREKMTLSGLMKQAREMVVEGGTVGAEIGSKALPLFGTGTGALIGTGIGTGGAIVATSIYFVKLLLGK